MKHPPSFVLCALALTATAVDAAPPNAPTDLRAAAPFLNSRQIEFQWEDNSDDEDGFEYELRIEETGEPVFDGTIAANEVLEGISGPIEFGDTLYFRVRAISEILGNSEWTDQVSITMPTTPIGIQHSVKRTVYLGEEFSYQPTTYGNLPTGYMAEALPAGLAIDPVTGTISGRPAERGVFYPLVSVTDGTSTPSTFVQIRVVLRDVPRVVQAIVGELVVFAMPDLGNEATAYSATGLPATMLIDPVSGEITGAFAETGSFPVTVTATGASEAVEYPLVFEISELDSQGALGAAYSFERFGLAESATVTSTGLPPGLSIDPATGIVSGRFGRAGSYETTVTIAGATQTIISNLTFEIPETVPYFTGAKVGQPLTYVPAKYGTTPGDFSSPDLPAGLSIDPVTGDVTGAPVEAGVFVPTIVMVSEGIPIESHVTFRIIESPQDPVILTSIPDQTIGDGFASIQLDIGEAFGDSEASSAVRIATNLGNLDVLLYERAAPLTVANFLNYVGRGDYTDVLFHRSTRTATTGLEVIQAGWFKPAETGFASVATDPAVQNEPGVSNVRGTIAMAKVSGNPNSGTSQWYFNVSSSATALDPPANNGGFTVFGRLSEPSLAVMDDIHSRPIGNYAITLNDGPRNITDWPTLQAPAGATPVAGEWIQIQSAQSIATLDFEVTGNSDPDAVTATLLPDGMLELARVNPGLSMIEVTATDLDGYTVSASFSVTVEAELDPVGLAEDTDHDGMNLLLEIALDGDPDFPDAGIVLPTLGEYSPLESSDTYLTLTFLHRTSPIGLRYTVEESADLAVWTPVWTPADGFDDAHVVNGAANEHVTVRASSPIGGAAGSGNLRLRVDYLVP